MSDVVDSRVRPRIGCSCSLSGTTLKSSSNAFSLKMHNWRIGLLLAIKEQIQGKLDSVDV